MKTDRCFPIEPLETRIAPAAAAIKLADLDGDNGFKLPGLVDNDFTGYSVSAAGDVNGDGIGDIIIGAEGAESGGTNRGAAYVIFGSAAGFSASVALSGLTGSNGFIITGAADNDRLGTSVGAAGDVNHDGIDDVIVGALNANEGGADRGAAYVIFGKTTAFTPAVPVSGLTGANGFKLTGIADSDYAGSSVAGAGDVNGDGIDDIIVGANGADEGGINRGAAYVVFGSSSAFNASTSLSTFTGTSGFKLTGAGDLDFAGSAVSRAGDVNGDGFDDVIVGADLANEGASARGAAYVFFGKQNGFAAATSLGGLNGTEGFKLLGEFGNDHAGRSVAPAGDINRDGFDDVMVGATRALTGGLETGAAYVILGKANGFSNVTLGSLSASTGFRIGGIAQDDQAGRSVAGVGDVNGDGFDDILVGARLADEGGFNRGAGYIIFGKAASFGAGLSLSALNGSNGYKLSGVADSDYTGTSASFAGDINGDGAADFLLGGNEADEGGDNRGVAYVVFGKAGSLPQPGKLAFSTDHKTAMFLDRDGDLVTVKNDKQAFEKTDFTLDRQGAGAQLESLDIHTDPLFANAKVSFTVKRTTLGGDGFVNVGRIDASGLDLAGISLPGDLGKVLAGDANTATPGLKALTVQSMGRFGNTTQGSGDLASNVQGAIHVFTVKSDLVGVDLTAGGIATLKVGGSLIGGGALQSGRINTTTLGSVAFGGSLIGGDGDNSAEIFASLGITGPVTISGSIVGGGGMNSGHINSRGDLGVVLVKHDVRGGGDAGSGLIEANNKIASVKIGGSLIGGAGQFSGSIRTDDDGVGPVTIGGSLVAGSAGRTGILSASFLGAVKIGGDVVGSAANPAHVSSGLGTLTSVTIGGTVRFAEILAGFNEFGTAVDGNAQLGTATVKGDWIASSISSGIAPGVDMKFGTADDAVIANATPFLASIGSIIVGGEARGTDGGGDSFGFVAEKIGSLKFGKGKATLTPDFDQRYVGPTFDLLARELDEMNPGAPDGAPTFNSNPLDISPDGKTATYTDVDGDVVTVKTDNGEFALPNFTMAAGPNGGFVLQKLDLNGDPDFADKNASITFTAKPIDGDGDGFVDVGAIDVSGADLKKLVLPGDLGVLKGDGFASIALHSLGSRGTNTQGASPSVHSDVGEIGALTIATDLFQATFATDGDLGTAKIGSLIGGTTGAVGELVVDGNLKAITVAHDIRGGTTTNTGRISATRTLGTVKVGGSIFGGGDEEAGAIEGVLGVGAVTVGGSIFGGAGDNSGTIYGHGIKSVKLGGDLVGGTGAKAGTIHTGAPPTDPATIGAVTIGGSMLGGAILSESTLGAVAIAGGAVGAKISAQGITTPTAKTALAIKSIKIGGTAQRLDILAGYDTSGAATNADVQIGAITIKGDAIETNIVAGIDGKLNGFGDADDILFGGGEQAAIVAKIASITIGGMALGEVQSLAPGDLYAFTAQEIGALKIGSVKYALSKPPPPDDIALGVTGDLRVRELA